MVKIYEHGEIAVLEVEVTDKLTEEDYDVIRPAVEEKINRFGEISILVHVSGELDFSAGALKEDLKTAFSNYSDFKKIALVGEADQLDKIESLGKVFPGIDMKSYQPHQVDLAWDWLKSKE